MVNLLQKIGGPVAVALTPFIVNAGQVGAESISIKEPSPTFPENSPVLVVESNKQRASSPTSFPSRTNPNSDRGDVVKSLSTKPIFVAQVAQRNEPRTAPPPPENYGGSEAGAIAELEMQIGEDKQNFMNRTEQNGNRFQEFLRNRQQQQQQQQQQKVN